MKGEFIANIFVASQAEITLAREVINLLFTKNVPDPFNSQIYTILV